MNRRDFLCYSGRMTAGVAFAAAPVGRATWGNLGNGEPQPAAPTEGGRRRRLSAPFPDAVVLWIKAG